MSAAFPSAPLSDYICSKPFYSEPAPNQMLLGEQEAGLVRDAAMLLTGLLILFILTSYRKGH